MGREGLVHVSEVNREKIKTPVGKFQVGDIVSAKVININPKERRIGLSVKQLETDEERDMVVNYLSAYKGSQSSLGELLKDNLKDKTVNEEPAEQASGTSPEKVEDPEVKGSAEVGVEDETEQVPSDETKETPDPGTQDAVEPEAREQGINKEA